MPRGSDERAPVLHLGWLGKYLCRVPFLVRRGRLSIATETLATRRNSSCLPGQSASQPSALAGEVDGRFAALFGLSGLLLIGMAIRAATNDKDWESFLAAQRRGRFGYPRGRVPRLWFGIVSFIIGMGWTVGGVLGVLAILGLYDFPEA